MVSKGRNIVNRKLTAEAVLAIRARYETGDVSQAALARDYGVSQMTVSKIVRRESWAAL